MREEGTPSGRGVRKTCATKSSMASSARQPEKRCAETHLFASLKIADMVWGYETSMQTKSTHAKFNLTHFTLQLMHI